MKEERLLTNEDTSFSSVSSPQNGIEHSNSSQKDASATESKEGEGLDKILSSIRQIMIEEEKGRQLNSKPVSATHAAEEQGRAAYSSGGKEYSLDNVVDLPLAQNDESSPQGSNQPTELKEEGGEQQVTELYASVDCVNTIEAEQAIDKEAPSLLDDVGVDEKATEIIQQNKVFKELLEVVLTPVIGKVLEKWLAENGNQIFKNLLKDRVNSIIRKSLED